MALVVGRKKGEGIVSVHKNDPENILAHVQVYKLEDGLIRLRIDAPEDIAIMRDEVFRSKEASEVELTNMEVRKNEN